jgi:TatD DNase family protein
MYTDDLILDQPLIFDSHSHYDDSRFDGIRDELFCDMQKNGVCGIVTCGCDESSSKAAIDIAEKYDFVYAAVGIHPESIGSGTTTEQIETLAHHQKCVAIGEIGLDYYWESESHQKQIEVFENMIMLSKKLEKPIIVHDRDAHADTLEILKRHKPKGVVHCFSGSVESAAEIVKLGMYIGVGGVATFKNARRLPEVIESVPLDRIVLETDCPYLAPEPFRGHTCHSAMIYRTALRVAELKGIDTLELLKITRENTKKLFGV